jgi:hypothetical protein
LSKGGLSRLMIRLTLTLPGGDSQTHVGSGKARRQQSIIDFPR